MSDTKALLKEIEELKSELKIYKDSPHENSYLACFKTIENFNDQLSAKKIDIFNVDETPIFEMAHKYLTELDGYLATLDKIRMRMNPEEAKAADQRAKHEKLNEKDKSLAL
jgi:hypothetical protein